LPAKTIEIVGAANEVWLAQQEGEAGTSFKSEIFVSSVCGIDW
jgi:hypothetical protein